MRRIVSIFVGVTALAALGLLSIETGAQTGFQIQTNFITGLNRPTAMAFAPDGRLFITEQGGTVRIVTPANQLLPTPFVTLSGVTNDQERGLLGIAFDPQFTINRYIYLFYTPGAFSRLSRITADASNPNVAIAGSLTTLFEYGNFSGNHRGGDIHFGPDGYLYVALGDAGEPTNSQSVTSFDGKILRLNKADGSAAPGNPSTFRNTSGQTLTPSGIYTRIWAIGLRNPYRFSFQDGTGTMRINDVGAGAFEEVNNGVAGSNYGWPTCEGLCGNANTRNPIYTHVRGVDPLDGCAITGGAWQSGGMFPGSYANDYFLIDYCRTWVKNLRVDDTFSTLPLAIPLDSADLKFAPDGSLLVAGNGSGTISRISYVGAGGNRNPVANGTATPTSGPTPLAVTFSSTGSSDPDGDPLTFSWAFGDSTSATGASVNHTYTVPGTYTATLTVTDGRGGVGSRTFTISAGRAPTPTITQPALNATYAAGNTISFAGTATDAEDGTLPASAFSWTVLFHHDAHTHPVLGPLTGTRSGSFVAPRLGHPEDTVFYRIYLTVRDSSGLQTTVTRDVQPRKARITLSSTPAGARVLLDGQPLTAPYSFLSVVGIQRTIEMPTPQIIGGQAYEFTGWSDGGSRTHVITAPASDTVYTGSLVASPSAGNRPRDLTATVARNNVALTWAPPAFPAQPVTGYVLEAGLSPGATQVTLPLGNVLGFATVAASGRYYVRVKAVSGATLSPASEEIVVATGQAAAPLAPAGLMATVVGTNITFTWRDNPLGPDIAYYQLHAGSAAGLSDLAILPLAPGARSYATAAPPGTYYVRVVPVNAAGAGPSSDDAVVTPGPSVCTAPDAPTGLTATVGPGTLLMTWDVPSTGAVPTGYRLDAGTTPGSTNIGQLPLGAVTAIGGPVASGRYYVRLAATNVCGASAVSPEITFAIP
jgi:glucose/arabinose dehydrogenase/PKD repeat protein